MTKSVQKMHHSVRGTINENGQDVKAIINAFTARYGDNNTVALSALSADTTFDSGIVMNANAFEELAVKWLAWRFGVSEDALCNVGKTAEQLARYRAAHFALVETFDDVPAYMGDQEYGNELAQVLSAARSVTDSWNPISIEEFNRMLSDDDDEYDDDEDDDDDDDEYDDDDDDEGDDD